MKNGVVSVEESGGGGTERGLVPVLVGWENGGLCVVLDFDNECFRGFSFIFIS